MDSNGDISSIFEGVLNDLFNILNDKDESVRHAVELSLIKIVEKHPDEALLAITEHKIKNPKLNEQATSILLRVIKNVALTGIDVNYETFSRVISMSIDELTKSNDNNLIIQKPALDILVAIGRNHCDMVMRELISSTKEGFVPHFMIMNCIGTLATSNVTGIAPFIKIVLGSILPNLNSIKHDHIRQAHAFAIGRLCEAILEGSTTTSETSEKSTEIDYSCSTEISVAYDVFVNQWLNCREPKVCVEILYALSNMYQLLPQERIQEQSIKIITILMNLYRRSIDRNAITQFLAAVIKTNIKYFPNSMDTIIDALLTTLFDLVCCYPDYEKPQTVKGHYEVLRCFYLLSEIYSTKILDMLLLHLRNNHERERIKALLVLTHLTNTRCNCIEIKLQNFLDVLKQLIFNEKQIKMKMTLLKTIVAFAQKSFIKTNREFVWFIVRNSCKSNKVNNEYGNQDEYNDLSQACQNSLYMLSSTVGTMDELLKRELLNYFLLLDYTDICSIITKCLASLFAKNSKIELDIEQQQQSSSKQLSADSCDDDYEDDDDDDNNDNNDGVKKLTGKSKTSIPTSEAIFIRCIVLMGNFREIQKITNILQFLKYYAPNIHLELNKLWDHKISDLLLYNGKEKLFFDTLIAFIRETIEFFDNNESNNAIDDSQNNATNTSSSSSIGGSNIKSEEFAEKLINKLSEQLILYPSNLPQHHEFFIPQLNIEKGMLLKCLGIILCYVNDEKLIELNIDLIINSVKHEKLDKHHTITEFEYKLSDAAKSLGYLSRKHLKLILKKLSNLANQNSLKKHSNNFFSNLIMLKDTHKEIEQYKMNLLIFESYGYIIENAIPNESLKDIDNTMIQFLIKQLNDQTKDQTMKKCILTTLLNICQQFIKNKNLTYELKTRNEILKQIFNIPIDIPPTFDNLPLFPIILKLSTNLLKIECDDDTNNPNQKKIPTTIMSSSTSSLGQQSSSLNDGYTLQTDNVHNLLNIACKNFFSCAQNLKTKFESTEDDERNSYLAQYLNQSLPELNNFVKIVIENDPSPSCLDDIITILEYWIKDKNSEVRICAGHVMNNSLECYIKSMKIGCEAPSKFNQTGQMLGRIVPRCIDSNATVRQTSVDILQKILEIACIYDTLTIADNNVEWIKDLEKIREQIITDDPKEIYQLAGDIAKIIANRLSNYQYLQFCKTLLYSLNDPEQSSSIGASVVLKFFIQQKGAELFHAIPDLVKECLHAIKHCEIARTKSGVLKSLVALTKHHPKLVCNEMLAQSLPFDEAVIEYWQTICIDLELTGTILENFLTILAASCLYEPNDGRQKIATAQPFAIFCALKEIFPSKEINTELKYKFPELFTMLLTSLATYTNLAPPMLSAKTSGQQQQQQQQHQHQQQNGKSKFGFIPNKDVVKMNPCQIVFDAFYSFLINLEMEQIANVLTVCPHLTTSIDLSNFIEILTPMAVAIVNQFTILSSTMKQIVTSLSKYVSSPYDGQRIAAIGLYSQLVPLKPCGEISSVIMLHLSSALSDPNPVVRGLCIRGLAFVGNLSEHDIDKYSETAITALLKGIDDYNSDCLINIPLESKRGLSRILQTLPRQRVESFHISLAIRIRPFFENSSTEIREAAILLFGDLCESKLDLIISSSTATNGTIHDGNVSPTVSCSSEALREQLFANFLSLLLHLSESDPTIIRACKVTLRKVCALLNASKVNEMAQKHLLDHGQLNYNVFLVDFVKVVGSELTEHVQDFIESCIPFLKSHWTEIRGNAAIIIGVLHNFLQTHNQNTEQVGHKLAVLLKDDNSSVRLKAATALGYFFGDV